jgi:hypothetical protein
MNLVKYTTAKMISKAEEDEIINIYENLRKISDYNIEVFKNSFIYLNKYPKCHINQS